MKQHFSFSALGIGAAVLFLCSTGCKKSDPVTATNGKAANSIDSVIGTYYGQTTMVYEKWVETKRSVISEYTGKDTIVLIREGSDRLRVTTTSFSRLYGEKGPFLFDSTGELNYVPDDRKSSSLYLYPQERRIWFSATDSVGNHVNGNRMRATFGGRK